MDVAVAVDIGGTKLAAGLVTPTGTLIDRVQAPVDLQLGADQLFDVLGGLVDDQLQRAVERHQVDPVVVGVGSAGPVQGEVDRVSPLNVPAWRDFPLRAKLEDRTQLPVYGGVDAKALALAEGWVGAARGRRDFLAMVVSTGVGGGIILDGQLLEGATGNAGHVGHVVVEPDGRRCACGSRGCLEAEASGPAIEAITGRPPTSPSYEIMRRTGTMVGRGVASVCNLLDLDLVVVGGSVALGFGATFFNAAQETLDQFSRLAFSRTAHIAPVRLGDQGPLIGAGAYGWRGHWRSGRP